MSFLKTSHHNNILTISLDRQEIHNAFNDELIDQLTNEFNSISNETDLVVLTGEGKSFCAGADLNWMRSMAKYSMEENITDSNKLALLFKTIDECEVPIIGRINGAAMGGGVGLVSVCDYTITHDKAKFGFTEVRLGLIPAVISPYCIRKIGEAKARAWFLSGEHFDANSAMQMGLIDEVVAVADFDNRCEAVINSFKKASPAAAREAKKLIRMVVAPVDRTKETVEAIAKQRISKEGQEGMGALLDKRPPQWSRT